MQRIILPAEHGEIKCYKIKNLVYINNIEQLIESAARKHFPECFNCSFILSGIYITGDAMNYKKLTQQYLHQWMTENNLTGDYVIHHRDDNDAVRAYNKANYKLWGHNLDGTFEYGKYIVFITRSEHMRHHNKNRSEETLQKLSENNAHYWKGKTLTNVHKQNISESLKGEKNPMYGKNHTDEAREKMSESQKAINRSGEKNPMYGVHRRGENAPHYGKTHTKEAVQKMSEASKKLHIACRLLFNVYHENGGKLKYMAFRRAIKNGDITFEMQPLSVYTNGGANEDKII